jgi:hypothetical protein
MSFDYLELLGRKPSRFQQNTVRNADLADIVQNGRLPQKRNMFRRIESLPSGAFEQFSHVLLGPPYMLSRPVVAMFRFVRR